MLLLNQVIEKQDKIIIINDSLYWRNSFSVGVSHEDKYLVVASAPYYPPDKNLIHINSDKYPIKQLRESLKSKHGIGYEDFYRPPEELRIDVLDEYTPKSLDELNDKLKSLRDGFDATCVTGSWEVDFARTRYLATPIEGGKAFFRELAVSALVESRVQISASAKKLLARNEVALITMGMACAALEKVKPYSFYSRYSAHKQEGERSLILTYS